MLEFERAFAWGSGVNRDLAPDQPRKTRNRIFAWQVRRGERITGAHVALDHHALARERRRRATLGAVDHDERTALRLQRRLELYPDLVNHGASTALGALLAHFFFHDSHGSPLKRLHVRVWELTMLLREHGALAHLIFRVLHPEGDTKLRPDRDVPDIRREVTLSAEGDLLPSRARRPIDTVRVLAGVEGALRELRQDRRRRSRDLLRDNARQAPKILGELRERFHSQPSPQPDPQPYKGRPILFSCRSDFTTARFVETVVGAASRTGRPAVHRSNCALADSSASRIDPEVMPERIWTRAATSWATMPTTVTGYGAGSGTMCAGRNPSTKRE